jgi:hypothetical protein
MSNGKDFKVFVSSAGTATTPLVQLEYQGDLTINTGQSNERSTFKNGTLTGKGESGFSASLQVGMAEPMPAAQEIVFDHADDATSVFVQFKGPTGSLQFGGVFKVSYTEISAPVSGVRMASLEFSQDGAVVRTVAA